MDKELNILYELLSKIPYPFTLKLDMYRSFNHWFLYREYFVIRPDYTVRDLQKKTILVPQLYVTDSYSNADYIDLDALAHKVTNANVLESIKRYWSDRLDIGSIYLIAYTDQSIENDGAIFYLYDSLGKNQGLYCSLLDWAKEIVRIGDNLEQFFDFEEALKKLKVSSEFKDNYKIPRKTLTSQQILKIENILDEYNVINPDFGESLSFDLQKRFIHSHILPLTKGDLYYDELKSTEEGIAFEWIVKDKRYIFDDKKFILTKAFFEILNQILEDFHSKKRLIIFLDYDREFICLTYINERRKKALAEVFNVKLITDIRSLS